MKLLRQIWKDEAGFVVSTELVLVATILVIGMVVGLATVRDAVVQELEDVALAIGNINQSYTYSGVSGCNSGTAGSDFQDALDACEASEDLPADPIVAIDQEPINEGEAVVTGSPSP